MKSSTLEKSKNKKKSLQEREKKRLVSSNVIVKLFISLEKLVIETLPNLNAPQTNAYVQ